ncbi:MAG: phosphatidylserine decarboxylase [Burkholderiales bacterium]|nr:phosphatidylserine decarboxylase [Burkholderiales bacterium]MDE2274772.1 phosphatidylserine decarboxylase [Burkholderiales bacterium]
MTDPGERVAVLLQHALPKQALTRLGGIVARARGGAATTALIRWFITRYGVDMAEAAAPDPAAYRSFNEFFTRALAPGARPLAAADWICPVDGAISQFGAIGGDRIFQAKGHDYSATALLGGDAALAAQFRDGHYATLYLSPRDYHRIHMPAAGRLRRMVHVPGALYSVNPATARGVPGLYARNERVVCLFDGERGPWVLVLVGATIVGSMATVWHGVVNPPRPRQARSWEYAPGAVSLRQGDEMGRFLLGSTVVLLWPRGPLRFDPAWQPGGAVRLGRPMAAVG